MIISTTDGMITQKVLNEETGEIVPQDVKIIKTRIEMKGGFSLVYVDVYNQILRKVIKSALDFAIIDNIERHFTYARVESSLEATKIAAEEGTTRQKSTK